MTNREPTPAGAVLVAIIDMFRMVIAEGRSLIRQRHEIEAQAHAALANNADYQRLR